MSLIKKVTKCLFFVLSTVALNMVAAVKME